MLAVQLVLLAVASGVASKSTRADKWTILNSELGGRLHASLPLAAPCFSVVDGSNVTVDAAACADVQSGYKSPLYRREKAPAYMLVSSNLSLLVSSFTSMRNRFNGRDANAQRKTVFLILPTPQIQTLILMELNVNRAVCHLITCVFPILSILRLTVPNQLDITGPEDVQAAFKFAARTKTLLSIKNSGHDYKGRSSQRGSLNLWVGLLSPMLVGDSDTSIT
jgi:hypothetical protein